MDFDDLEPTVKQSPPFSISDRAGQAPLSATAGASVYLPSTIPGDKLNPRSCLTCRKRRVRCDKQMPCANCRRAQISCAFPAPGRAPRRPKPRDVNAPAKTLSNEREFELMQRLRKLEGIVEELSGQVEAETSRQHSHSDSPDVTFRTRLDESFHEHDYSDHESSPSRDADGSAARLPRAQTLPANGQAANKKFGRIVIKGRDDTSYVSSKFLCSLTRELQDLRVATDELSGEASGASDGDSLDGNSDDRTLDNHQGFLFGYSSADVDLTVLHPQPSQIAFLWQRYCDTVDNACKILHAPSMESLVRQTQEDPGSLAPNAEALMFSVYHAAVTAMDEDDVQNNFQLDKASLIIKYRFALEQAFAKANILTSIDFMLLQALALFLLLHRRNDSSRFTWTMVGLALRLGQGLGLHRDGSNFPNLTPFEGEMRRRLFWTLCSLDMRSAEDHGSELVLIESQYDTRLPLNINDADISPESTSLPQTRTGPTDMTLSLVRFELCAHARCLYNITTGMSTSAKESQTTLAQREAKLLETCIHFQQHYFADKSSLSSPLIWAAYMVARVIMGKMLMLIYQSGTFSDDTETEGYSNARERLFTVATELCENNLQFLTDERAKKWRWLIQTYTPWHSITFLLIEMIRRPWGPTVERAWSILNVLLVKSSPLALKDLNARAAIWVPFKRLHRRAHIHRDRELKRLRADVAASQKVERDDSMYESVTATCELFRSDMPAKALERWRQLMYGSDRPPAAYNISSASTAAAATRSSDNPMPVADSAPGAANLNIIMDPHTMSYLDKVMSQPPMSLESFWPLVNTKNGQAPGRLDAVSQDTGEAAGSLGPTLNVMSANTGRELSNNDPSRLMASTQFNLAEDSMVDDPATALGQDNPVPWLYGYEWNTDASRSLNTTNINDPAGADPPQMLERTTDLDMDADNDIDWQNWGQAIMEQTGSAAGGLWATHGL